MKRWEFVYKTKNGSEKIINNENCWKHLEENIWRGIAWCSEHVGTILLIGGASALTVVAGKQIKRRKDAEEIRDILYIDDAETAQAFAEMVAENPHIKVEHI